MISYFIKCLIVIFAFTELGVSAVDTGRTIGFASDCPGSEKKVIITKKNFKYLTLTVQGRGDVFGARKKKYDYFHVHQIIDDPDFDLNRKTVIYAGGYLDSANFPFAQSMMKVYTDVGYNALAFDTNWFTTTVYPLACRRMRPVGLHLAEMILTLTKLGLDPKRVELIGLSLGAHTIAYAAQSFRELTGLNFTRLTGLDPAGPCFRNLGPEDRLDPSDADFVDHIATNIDDLGMATPTGQVTFYVNGGEYQPGPLEGAWLGCDNLCRHVRSFTLWLSAVQHPNKFVGVKCNSIQEARFGDCYKNSPTITNIMGLNTHRNITGIFYLNTSGRYPFYMGKKGLKQENDFWKSHLEMLDKEEVIVF